MSKSIETFSKVIKTIQEAYIGFVYKVLEISTGKIYIGSKEFGSKPDWRSYKTSNVYLKSAIAKNINNYEFEVLGYAMDKTALKLLETELILRHNSLDPSIGYNANIIINIRCQIKELTNRKKEIK